MIQKRYIKSLDMELSPLGFGVMRLNQNRDGTFPKEVFSLIAEAYANGINYFDTAWPYLRGCSEQLVREALVEKYPRESFYIADKMPVWECSNTGDMERIFQTQLERLGVKYIDFYLLHGLHKSRWNDIYAKGVLGFIEKKQREGKINKAGFSLHDNTEILKMIMGKYDWDFVQLQINYYDWIIQHAKESYEYLETLGVPCMVMEPVGGGRLSRLPDRAEKMLKTAAPEHSLASWAVRFAASLPDAAVVLSGMSNEEQLRDNISSFSPLVSLNKKDLYILEEVVKTVCSYNTIPCTSCRYCVDNCPKQIDIPQIFQRYNDFKMFTNTARFDIDYFAFIPEGKRADACIACGKCVKKCPQNITIPHQLKMIHETAVKLSTESKEDQKTENIFVRFYSSLKTRGIAGTLQKIMERVCSKLSLVKGIFCTGR